jgi:hypothetical protein
MVLPTPPISRTTRGKVLNEKKCTQNKRNGEMENIKYEEIDL